MPRAFLIHQKSKVKKAKADSSTDCSPDKPALVVGAIEQMCEVDPVRGYEGDVDEDMDGKQMMVVPAGYQLVRKSLPVADKEITCSPGNPPAEKPIFNPFPVTQGVVSDNRTGAHQYVPSAVNNGYQLHSGDRSTRPTEAIHLSQVKVEPNENTELERLTKQSTGCGDYRTIEDGPLESKYSKSAGTKRAFSNCYGILDPLHCPQQNNNNNTKRARYDGEESHSAIGQAEKKYTGDCHTEIDSKEGVMNKTLAINSQSNTNGGDHSVKGSTYVTQVQKTPLPAFNTCFTDRNGVVDVNRNTEHGDGRTSIKTELHRPHKKQFTRYTVDELTKSDVKVHSRQQELLQRVAVPDSKLHRRSSSRPLLPHPYWSPLKIEVPHFEPSPLKMTTCSGSNGQQLVRGGGSRYQMSSSPVSSSSDISPPSLPESPLNGAEEELARRLSDSDRSDKDSMLDRASPAEQEIFPEHESSSSDEATVEGRPTPKGQFWVEHNKMLQEEKQHKHQTPRHVVPELHKPSVGKVKKEVNPLSAGLRLHDPYFWQNNLPNLPMDFPSKIMSPFHQHSGLTPPPPVAPTPLSASSPLEQQMRDYQLMAMPHYLNYLHALEKGSMMMPFPYHPMWRAAAPGCTPAEAAFPHLPSYLVNPAFMDPRYMQYQAEKLKCESPVYKNSHLTPTTPVYKDSMREKSVTINEHIYSNERPMSLESAASDKLSTISDDSTFDTVKSSIQIKNNHASGKSSAKHNCEWCGKSYSTFSGLAKHKQFHCSKQIVKHFNCQHCDKEYTSLGALKMHIRTHTLPCKCHICGKAFSRPWLLQGHIRTHTGEKPFSCQHCSRAFADRSNLRAHLQTHSEVKKYSCEQCGKTFSRMSLLIKHKESGCNTVNVM